MPTKSVICGRTIVEPRTRRRAGMATTCARTDEEDRQLAPLLPAPDAAGRTAPPTGRAEPPGVPAPYDVEINIAAQAIAIVENLLLDCPSTQSKAGWCLRQGLLHVATVDDGLLLPIIQRFGLPAYLDCCRALTTTTSTVDENTTSTPADTRVPTNSFESLCRIVAGQSISGVSAAAAWKRLLTMTHHNLTPASVLRLVDNDDDDDDEIKLEINFRKPAGLTKGKARSIVDLARHFDDGSLSEEFLMTTSDPDTIRSALLQVKGIGPWSCDMFLQFYLEHSNILPLGDLGVRKGIAKQFGIQATGNNKKDATVRQRLQVYEPYLSIVTFYMWRVADTPDVISATGIGTNPTTLSSLPNKLKKRDREEKASSSTPTTARTRRKVSRHVTP